jgi:hypothetical protein
MKTRTTAYCSIFFILSFFILFPVTSFARWVPDEKKKGKEGPPAQRILVLDGSNVHNIGELQMHVGNWGNYGSWPGSGNTFSEAPSAQWPAGSGIEYLFVAGLWVGAVKSGIPAVSTAAYATEFRPSQDPREIIYRTAEGARGGNRLPSPSADDDRDGFVDEDWLNGRDDDEDGAVDEDYAAVSKQMFSCWYTDDQPYALQIFPQHNPLHLLIRQESYQWEEDRFDDFVGIEYKILNYGTDILEDVYIGFFADCDAGARDGENYWEDDATGRIFVPIRCTDLGPVQIDFAYTYDADGDDGETEGYFGVMFMGHTTDPTGDTAPERVGISTYANFSGSQSFEEGGDPTNDFERYELLSQETIERDATVPRDYRMLVSAGPFQTLYPDSVLIFQVAFVIGAGANGSIRNAASAQLTYDGAWFNLDGNPLTGIDARETPIPGPVEGVVIDSCREELRTPVNWNQRTPIYINNDCAREELFKSVCIYTENDSAKYQTGIGGKEEQIFWIVGTAPPPPNMRLDDHNSEGIAIYWDNFSETVPDVKTQVFDFEGYRVWRADNWDRPLGTSALNGPAHDLWKLLFEADAINNFSADTGLDRYRYEPLTSLLTPTQKADFIEYIKAHLTEFPTLDPPCPQGVGNDVCDTLVALAKWDLGLTDQGGRQYYRYIDKAIHQGRPYFYAVTAMDHDFQSDGTFQTGKAGDPSSNFQFVEPKSVAQNPWAYDPDQIFVVPNPATTQSMAAWTLEPNNEDPTGIKVEFRNLPASEGIIRIYTLSGDLVEEIIFDGTNGVGTAKWDLVSRNGQDVTSGIYLFSVESENSAFSRKVGKFVVIR